MQTRFIFFSILICFFLYRPLPAQQENQQPRVAVVPMANHTADSQNDALCNTVTDTVQLTLNLLNRYQVERVFGVDLYNKYEEAVRYLKFNKFDYALFGRTITDQEGVLVLEMSVYDRVEDSVTLNQSEKVLQIFDVFDASDTLVVNIVESFSGVHIGFGTILLTNNGEKGTYTIFIDGKLVGSTLSTLDKVLIGQHIISVKQDRMLGDFALLEQQIDVIEDQIIELGFSIPFLLEREQAVLNGLEATVLQNWDNPGQQDKVENGISQLLALLDDISYCEKLLELKWKYEKWQETYLSGGRIAELGEVETAEQPQEQPVPELPEEPTGPRWQKDYISIGLATGPTFPTGRAFDFMRVGYGPIFSFHYNLHLDWGIIGLGAVVTGHFHETLDDRMLVYYPFNLFSLTTCLDIKYETGTDFPLAAWIDLAAGAAQNFLNFKEDFPERENTDFTNLFFEPRLGIKWYILREFSLGVFAGYKLMLLPDMLYTGVTPGISLELHL